MSEGVQQASPGQTADRSEGSPAKLRRRLAGDVDNIILMALRKEPNRRYASVEQLAEDIHRHLDGLPVLAVKGSTAYRASKFIRRHRASLAAGALVAIALGVGVVATIRGAADRPRDSASAPRIERKIAPVSPRPCHPRNTSC
jgi:eukaryotic-like serine/threonine-protein kinase